MGFVLTFLARRLVQGAIIVLLVSFTIFALLRLIPGDPARMILGPVAPDALVEQTAVEMGLRDPIVVQSVRYLAQIATGDFGTSVIKSATGGSITGGRDEARGSRTRVIDLIAQTLPFTLQLAGLTLLFTVLIAVPLRIDAGMRAGCWPDKLTLDLSSIFVSVPNVWFAIVPALIVTARLQWIPSIG